MRYYYKNKDNTGFLNLKSPLNDERYVQITEEEFNELSKPKSPELTAEQKEAQEKAKKIAELKKKLSDTNYATINYLEGELPEEVYLPIKQNREMWRRQINILQYDPEKYKDKPYTITINLNDYTITVTTQESVPPVIEANEFLDFKVSKVVVPKGCSDAYKTATNWVMYSDCIEEVE